jgi:hypothetical protein
VLAALAILGAAAGCNKNKPAETSGTAAGKESYDYSKILKGDLSDFAGTWVNGKSDTLQLGADGNIDDRYSSVDYVRLNEDGTYQWGLSTGSGSEGIGLGVTLYPVGVDAYDDDGKILQSDKTKVRIYPYREPSSDVLYYLKTSGKAAPAETSGTAAGKETYNYSKILKGDLSDFVGRWEKSTGESRTLSANGTFDRDRDPTNFHFNETDGTYAWGVSDSGDGAVMVLYPVGVDAVGWMAEIIPTDKTKVRLTRRMSPPDSSDDFFYPQTSGKAATSAQTVPYYATSNLRLRSEPDTSKDNRIAGVSQGSKVELLEIGKTETIDNISAPWYKVKTADGTIGWLFSGYLTAAEPNKSYDYTKILKGNLSDFAGTWKNGNGETRTLRKNGTFDRGDKASGFTSQNNPKQASGGDFYMWGVSASEGGGFGVTLYPIGVDVMGYDGIIPTDKTKVRLAMGHDLPSSSANVFYLE